MPEGGEVVDLLATVRRLKASSEPVPFEDFHRAFSGLKQNMTPHEMDEIVEFTSEQCARWTTQWSFSPAASPDRRAKEESDAWEHTFGACLDALAEQLPDVREPSNRRHNLTVLGGSLRRRVRETEGKPLARFVSVFQSKAGILANRLGLPGLGSRLYRAGLFPKGTVGRRGAREESRSTGLRRARPTQLERLVAIAKREDVFEDRVRKFDEVAGVLG
jgi:hypothetical protein